VVSRIPLWLHALVLACSIACIAYVLFAIIPAYDAIGPDAPPGARFIWLPEIARGELMSRAGWLTSASSAGFLVEAARFRRPTTLALRFTLAVAMAGVAVNAAVWIRHGGGMIHALSWLVRHDLWKAARSLGG
jgi:hypothetical protein